MQAISENVEQHRGYVWVLHEGGKRRTMTNERFSRVYQILTGYDDLSHEQKTQLIIDDAPFLVRDLERRIVKDREIIALLEAHIGDNK